MTINYRYPNCQVRVSIHTPTQGVTISFDGYLLNRQFQSTHPRRVWLRIAYEKVGIINVSIHTPTQGVTLDIHLSYTEIVVSIHTPTQGVTVPGFLRLSLYRCFNPHTHAGCDISQYPNSTLSSGFNPHTHAGCDGAGTGHTRQDPVSIHTPTQGVTLCSMSTIRLLMFQSTHPRRVWLAFIRFVINVQRFNPHTHAGCDDNHYQRKRNGHVSIHTPTQGVTLYLITYYKSANLIHCYANHHYYSTS